jgi:hypothetical protein
MNGDDRISAVRKNETQRTRRTLSYDEGRLTSSGGYFDERQDFGGKENHKRSNGMTRC